MGRREKIPDAKAVADITQYPGLLKKIRTQQAEDAKRAASSTADVVGQDNVSPELQSQPASIRAH
jgi:hypothetical protein